MLKVTVATAQQEKLLSNKEAERVVVDTSC